MTTQNLSFPIPNGFPISLYYIIYHGSKHKVVTKVQNIQQFPINLTLSIPIWQVNTSWTFNALRVIMMCKHINLLVDVGTLGLEYFVPTLIAKGLRMFNLEKLLILHPSLSLKSFHHLSHSSIMSLMRC